MQKALSDLTYKVKPSSWSRARFWSRSKSGCSFRFGSKLIALGSSLDLDVLFCWLGERKIKTFVDYRICICTSAVLSCSELWFCVRSHGSLERLDLVVVVIFNDFVF